MSCKCFWVNKRVFSEVSEEIFVVVVVVVVLVFFFSSVFWRNGCLYNECFLMDCVCVLVDLVFLVEEFFFYGIFSFYGWGDVCWNNFFFEFCFLEEVIFIV